MDLDLSNMGCFSLRPQDLIRMGLGTENQFDGVQFKASENIDSLPQIISQKRLLMLLRFGVNLKICVPSVLVVLTLT
jgi:hypothetical protein